MAFNFSSCCARCSFSSLYSATASCLPRRCCRRNSASASSASASDCFAASADASASAFRSLHSATAARLQASSSSCRCRSRSRSSSSASPEASRLPSPDALCSTCFSSRASCSRFVRLHSSTNSFFSVNRRQCATNHAMCASTSAPFLLGIPDTARSRTRAESRRNAGESTAGGAAELAPTSGFHIARKNLCSWGCQPPVKPPSRSILSWIACNLRW
mmetsp:Transcript_77805/g.155818  ORF Transcript_77805/g.155818 Transcript_77805/m.155818 type:complete len:217 (-) Transcript_77805:587-1237(-)